MGEIWEDNMGEIYEIWQIYGEDDEKNPYADMMTWWYPIFAKYHVDEP